MDIFNPAINHTFRVPDDATPDEINGIIGSVEQQAQSRAGILGGLGAVGRMVQSLDAPHYPTVDPVAAMAMTPQALNATLQRQAESRQQQEAIAQRERESTAQALQQEKDRRVRLQVMQQQMKNDEADRKIREQQMALQERQINASIEQDQARAEAAKRPQVKALGTGGSYMVTDPLTGEVKYVASEYDRQYQQARLNRENRMGTGGGGSGEPAKSWTDAAGVTRTMLPGGVAAKTDANGVFLGWEKAGAVVGANENARADRVMKLIGEGYDMAEAQKMVDTLYPPSGLSVSSGDTQEQQAARMRAAGYTVKDGKWVKRSAPEGMQSQPAQRQTQTPARQAIPGVVVSAPPQRTMPRVGLSDVFSMEAQAQAPQDPEAVRRAEQQAAYEKAQADSLAAMRAQAAEIDRINAQNAAFYGGAQQFDTISAPTAAAPQTPAMKPGTVARRADGTLWQLNADGKTWTEVTR